MDSAPASHSLLLESFMRSSSALPILPAFALVIMIGCGGTNGTAPTATAPGLAPSITPPSVDLPSAPNLEYVNWKQFKVGTTVVRKKVVQNKQGSLTETTTVRLAELTDTKAVIEQQITVARPDSPPVVNPPMRLECFATFKVPPGLTAEQMSKPSLKAKATGEETVTACGKEYKATVYEWQDATEAGPMPNKLWLSDAVPGRRVKQEMKVEKVGNSTTEEVIEIKLP